MISKHGARSKFSALLGVVKKMNTIPVPSELHHQVYMLALCDPCHCDNKNKGNKDACRLWNFIPIWKFRAGCQKPRDSKLTGCRRMHRSGECQDQWPTWSNVPGNTKLPYPRSSLRGTNTHFSMHPQHAAQRLSNAQKMKGGTIYYWKEWLHS